MFFQMVIEVVMWYEIWCYDMQYHTTMTLCNGDVSMIWQDMQLLRWLIFIYFSIGANGQSNLGGCSRFKRGCILALLIILYQVWPLPVQSKRDSCWKNSTKELYMLFSARVILIQKKTDVLPRRSQKIPPKSPHIFNIKTFQILGQTRLQMQAITRELRPPFYAKTQQQHSHL